MTDIRPGDLVVLHPSNHNAPQWSGFLAKVVATKSDGEHQLTPLSPRPDAYGMRSFNWPRDQMEPYEPPPTSDRNALEEWLNEGLA